MALVVVLERAGIEPNSDRWYFRIQGDPSIGGLAAGVGSLAVQEDSTPKAQIWEKTSGVVTGWTLVTSLTSSQATTVSLEQYGSFKNGVADATLDVPAMNAAVAALASLGGGILQLNQMYSVDQSIEMDTDAFGNITIVGQRPGCGFTRTANATTNTNGTILRFVGATAYSLKNIRLQGVTFSGHSTSDYTKLVVFGHCDGIYVDNCRFLNNAVEGLYFEAPRYCRNAYVTNCYAENVGMAGAGGGYLSAYNVNVDNCLVANCTARTCGLGIEQTGRNARLIGNEIDSCLFAGMAIVSTWASWIDAGDGTTIHTSNNVLVAANSFVSCSIAVHAADYTGHTDTTGTPTVVPGNAGGLTVEGNTLYACNLLFNGGADSLGQVVVRGNYVEGAFGNQNPIIWLKKGRGLIEGNTFRQGTVLWSELMRIGIEDPINTSAIVRNNTAIGKGWTNGAFTTGPTTTFLGNIFENVPVDTSPYYTFVGPNYLSDAIPVSNWILTTDSWFVPQDPEFCYSPTQQSRLRVNGAPPAKGTWKVGDRVDNIASTGVIGWRCTVAGTFDTIATGVTATTTSGSASFTVTASTSKVLLGQWITIAGVTGRFQILAFNPTTGAGTLSATAGATVTSAAVAFSAGSWQAVGLASATHAVTTTYAVGPTDQILYYTASAPYTITLPLASLSEGLSYTFLRTDNSGFVVTIAAAGSDTINGSATYVPPVSQFFAATLICTNGSWTYRTNKPVMADLQAGTATGSGYILPDLTVTGGITNSLARFDAGNSGAAKTLTWTAARRQQKCTLSTATPAITIDDTAIPSGEYLVTDLFEDPTGSRIPTFALTSAGTINWVGGSAPTLTTTATKADRIIWENEGSRITAWLALANF